MSLNVEENSWLKKKNQLGIDQRTSEEEEEFHDTSWQTCNGVLGSLPRKFNSRSHPTPHDDPEDPHPIIMQRTTNDSIQSTSTKSPIDLFVFFKTGIDENTYFVN